MSADAACPEALSADAVLADLARVAPGALVGPRTVLLIDGRSGSGKTVLAGRLAAATGFQLVPLAEIHPGWDGLDAGSTAVHETVLRASSPGYHRWDWLRSAPADWVALDAARPVIVEGCGALSRANRALATGAIWLSAPTVLRRERAIARDGEVYARNWDRWAAQEDAFIARERPEQLADLVLSTG